jgi:septal ring-binding cell division protein DamX
MSKLRIIFLYVVLFFAMATSAQAQGVNLNEDGAVVKLFDQYIRANQATENVTGWVVQIISTTDRRQMEALVKNFQLKNPDIYIDWVQEKPYYKVYIGGFRTKLEAARLLSQFRSEYTGSFILKNEQLRPIAFIQS